MQRQAFVPKARLIQILGEHLIKDATVGLLELVKNSYDADATSVQITMSSLNTHDSKISIKDNGQGMDVQTFIDKWMNPATGHKQTQKENRVRTKLKRLPLGEKGVGRFAAQQIGNKLQLVSKTIEMKEQLCVLID
jgi:HSP90 family molecular chaperone